jgi:hypothetical protein
MAMQARPKPRWSGPQLKEICFKMCGSPTSMGKVGSLENCLALQEQEIAWLTDERRAQEAVNDASITFCADHVKNVI